MDFLRGGFPNLRLDIVGFIALLGESLVLVHAQVASISNFTYLPRLIPAPNAMIRIARPSGLPPAPGIVIGVYSGNFRNHVNYMADLVHGKYAKLRDFEVRCIHIHRDDSAAELKIKRLSYLTVVTCLGCVIAGVNLGLSVMYNDGMALLATILLSLLSTVLGIGNKSTLNLGKRVQKEEVPPGDVVVAQGNGSFLIVRCHEDIARQLYFAGDEIQYNIENMAVYRFIALSATLLLIGGIIALANATTKLQLSFAASYVIVNTAYWFVDTVPANKYWDLRTFKTVEQRINDHNGADQEPVHNMTLLQKAWYSTGHKSSRAPSSTDIELPVLRRTSFTEALWRAIFISGSTEWAKLLTSVPKTSVWDKWLEEVKVRISEDRERFNEGRTADDRPDEDAAYKWTLPTPTWNAKKAWYTIYGDMKKGNTLDRRGSSATTLQGDPAEVLHPRKTSPKTPRFP